MDLPFQVTALVEPSFLPRCAVLIVGPRFCSFWGIADPEGDEGEQ